MNCNINDVKINHYETKKIGEPETAILIKIAVFNVGFTEKVAFKFNELILAFSCLHISVKLDTESGLNWTGIPVQSGQ